MVINRALGHARFRGYRLDRSEVAARPRHEPDRRLDEPLASRLVRRGVDGKSLSGQRGTKPPGAAEVVMDGLARHARLGGHGLDGELAAGAELPSRGRQDGLSRGRD